MTGPNKSVSNLSAVSGPFRNLHAAVEAGDARLCAYGYSCGPAIPCGTTIEEPSKPVYVPSTPGLLRKSGISQYFLLVQRNTGRLSNHDNVAPGMG